MTAPWAVFLPAVAAGDELSAMTGGTGTGSPRDDDGPPHIELDVPLADGTQQVLRGQLLAEMSDDQLMVEESTGAIYIIPGVRPDNRRAVEEPFQYLTDEQMAAFLKQQMGESFRVVQTEHYVLCSQAGDLFTEYCGKLLERVHEEFYEFFEDRGLTLQPLRNKLPVIVMRDAASLQAFASRQHPETDFADTPGYYSVRHNQMLISGAAAAGSFRRVTDVAREMREHVRQVETIVHEAVHQLSYNSGLQVRYADNPVWLSEGLAVFFESTSGRASLGWGRPGEVSRLHLPTLKSLRVVAGTPVFLESLAVSPEAFLDERQAARAYAESWATFHYLASRQKQALMRLLKAYQQAKPGVGLGAERHTELLEDALGESLADGESTVLRYVKRLRSPR
ncbi:MAG: DUF1570 domain-containing protein [Planctomycetaceae bacterium]|nr:DUF1570 domain-containing protein [Planctomycetaceae bacterium]